MTWARVARASALGCGLALAATLGAAVRGGTGPSARLVAQSTCRVSLPHVVVPVPATPTGGGVLLRVRADVAQPAPWPLVRGAVLAGVPDGAGGWYVGGAFSALGGKPEQRLAHVTAAGVVDARFHATANAPVLAIARTVDSLVVAGRFTTVDGAPHPYLASIDRLTGAVRPFAATVDGPVRALAAAPTALYLGGAFSTVDSVSRRHLAAIDPATGALLPFDPVDVRSVNALSDTGSVLYVGGSTERQNAAPVAVAAVDDQTGAALPFEASAGGSVRALAVAPGRLYVGGRFASVDGEPRRDLAALDLATGSPTVFAPRLDGAVNALAVRDGIAYAGGGFAHASGEPRAGLVALAPSGLPTAWDAELHAGRGRPQILSVSVAGGHVLAGGRFRGAGPLVERLADLGVRSARLTPFAPRPRVAGSVEAAFAQTSTAAGRAIRLLVRPPVGALTMQFVRSGAPVSGAARIACAPSSGSALSLSLTAPRAPSGFYLARLQAGRRTGFAPLILRPSGADAARVAIVLPTNTWQAYNRRDDDGDGVGDTWYACHTASCWSAMSASGVDTTRPFLDHGLPRDSLRFLDWLDARHLQADVLGDDDLNRVHSAGPWHGGTRSSCSPATPSTSRPGSSTSSRATATMAATSRFCRRTTSFAWWSASGRDCAWWPASATSGAPRQRSKASSTSTGITASTRTSRTPSPMPRAFRGCSRERACTTARASAASASRSMPGQRHRRPARTSLPRSPTSSARVRRPR